MTISKGNRTFISPVELIQWAVVALSVILFLPSCSSDDTPEPEEITPQIIFLFSPGGLGDLSYNDCILKGAQIFKMKHPEVDLFMYSPSEMEEAERIFSDWMKRPGSNIPVLFALASSDYEIFLDKYLPLYELTSNKRILLFESQRHYDDEKVRTFQVSMFGASFLAGKTALVCAGEKPSLIMLGSSTDIPTFSARDGFMAGYGRDCDVEYLSTDWSGYVMPSFTYKKMSDWSRDYGFIFPVAGGSNSGLYRYTREYADSPYLAGMDIDQSDLSPKITGSVVKHFEILVDEYLSEWLYTGTMPESQTYGLESGYVDWVLSPRYESLLKETVESYRQEAIRKEKAEIELQEKGF